jgi:hypothetical protein
MSEPQTNRVMRFTVSEDFSNVADRTDIVEDIPYKVARQIIRSAGPAHTTAAASGSIREMGSSM